MDAIEIWVSENGRTVSQFTLWETVDIEYWLQKQEYEISGLKPDTRYWIMIRDVDSTNPFIKGAFSEVLEFKTTLTDDPGRQLLLSKNNIDFYSHAGVIVNDGGDVLAPLDSDTTYYAKLKGVVTPEESNTIIFTTLREQNVVDSRDVCEDDFIISGVFFRNRVCNESNTANTISFSFDAKHFSKKRKYCTEVE
jgi:hypothetical protein